MISYVSLKRKLRQARALAPRDWALLLQAWVLLLGVDLALRTLPFPRVRDAAARGRVAKTASCQDRRAEVTRVHRLVDTAARHHLYPMRCLRRSLALQRLLARRGILSELRLGVSKDAAGLSAHAWLEIDGTPVGERASVVERFAPLRALGASQ